MLNSTVIYLNIKLQFSQFYSYHLAAIDENTEKRALGTQNKTSKGQCGGRYFALFAGIAW